VIFYAVVMLQYDVVLTSIGIAFVAVNLICLAVGTKATRGLKYQINAGARKS